MGRVVRQLHLSQLPAAIPALRYADRLLEICDLVRRLTTDRRRLPSTVSRHANRSHRICTETNITMLQPGALINQRYQIVRQVGQGGMGAVYEAIDTRLGHHVALKQTLISDPQYVHAFEREARLLAHLKHAHLPRVTDHFSDADGQFLVMDFILGEDLAALFHQHGGPFPLAQVLTWADQLLDALTYLHSQNPPVSGRRSITYWWARRRPMRWHGPPVF